MFADGAGGAVEVARDKDAGGGFEGDIFDRVAVVRAAVADDGVEGRALWPRGEAGGLLDTGAEVGGVGVPACTVGKLGEGGVEDGGTLGGFEEFARAKRRPGGRGGRETGWEPRHIGAGEGDGGKRK